MANNVGEGSRLLHRIRRATGYHRIAIPNDTTAFEGKLISSPNTDRNAPFFGQSESIRGWKKWHQETRSLARVKYKSRKILRISLDLFSSIFFFLSAERYPRILNLRTILKLNRVPSLKRESQLEN